MLATTQDTGETGKTPNIRVYTLGTFRVLVGGQVLEEHAWRRKTARQLFKVLLTRPGRRMTRDEAVELFWPESDAEAAASNLRSTLFAMRRALEVSRGDGAPEVIFGDHTSVWLGNETEVWMDAVVFERKVAEAWRSPDPLPLLEEASAMYAGDYLPDDLFEDWAGERRQALKRTWTELQFGLAQALESRKDVSAALLPLERLLRADPCDERAAQELMKMLTRYGRRAEALRAYQRLVQSLRDDLGVEPSPDTVELHRQIGAGEAVAAPPIPAAAFRCTYPFPTPSELIGREREVGVLSRVLSDGRTAGRVALIGAPAGTGKSALLGQILRQAQAQGVLCIAGGCYEERGAVPLGPFHDALLDYLLVQPPETLRPQMAAYADDLVEVIPELRYHLEMAVAPGRGQSGQDRLRAFGAVHAYLRSLAQNGPVLVCLEDLHAADEATLQLIHYLARQTRRLPLVIIATYRDDEAPAEQPLAQTLAAMVRERLAEALRLSPLDQDDTRLLVRSLLDGSPSQMLGQSLFAATGGNPLFLEQLVLALGETGQLERKAGEWHGTRELQATPHIVREVIAQRLQRLEASCRDVLDGASVLGQSFEHRALLAAVEPRDEASVLTDIDHAIRAQVLQETPGGYAFRHALLRDAVYFEMTAAKRMLLHSHAAAVLERLYGDRADEHAAELAHHFGLAGESAELRAKRLRYSLLAGRRAAQLSAYPQALDHFSRAWEVLQHDASFPDVDLQVEVLQGRGWAEAQMARWRDTVATYQHALSLLRDPVARARAYSLVGFAFTHVGDLPRVVEECSAGLAELVGIDGPEVTSARLQLQQVLAMTLHWQGRYRDLVQLGQLMQDEAGPVGPRPRMLANSVTAWGYWGMGRVRKATRYLDLAAGASEEIGEKLQIATCQENLGLVALSGGLFESARQHFERSLQLFAESATELRGVNALHGLCRVWVAEGDLARARENLERVLPLEVEGNERWAADGYCILAIIQSLTAEWEPAEANFQRAVQMRLGAGHRAGAAEATIGLGLVYQYTGRWTDAAATFDSAVRITSEMDMSPAQVMAQRHKGVLQLIMGDLDTASVAIEDAFALARDMPESVEFAPSVLAMAMLRAVQNQRVEAIALAEEALASARTARLVIEVKSRLARLDAEIGQDDLARMHADEAVSVAEALRSPWLLSLAVISQAQVTSRHHPDRANALFERAVQLVEQARMPYERAQALDAYAAHLRMTNQPGPSVMRAQAEAARVLVELRSGKSAGPAVTDK